MTIVRADVRSTRACAHRRTHATDVRADEQPPSPHVPRRKEDQAPTHRRRHRTGGTARQKASQRRITITATQRANPDLDLLAQALAMITRDLERSAQTPTTEPPAPKGPRP